MMFLNTADCKSAETHAESAETHVTNLPKHGTNLPKHTLQICRNTSVQHPPFLCYLSHVLPQICNLRYNSYGKYGQTPCQLVNLLLVNCNLSLRKLSK